MIPTLKVLMKTVFIEDNTSGALRIGWDRTSVPMKNSQTYERRAMPGSDRKLASGRTYSSYAAPWVRKKS
jgi:hypothetical protein